MKPGASASIRLFAAVCLFSLLVPSCAPAWDNHFLLTRAAVQTLGDELPILDTQVKPTTLASFLARNNTVVKNTLNSFHEWKQQVYPYQQWMLSSSNRALLQGKEAINQAQFLEILGVASTAFSKVVVPKEFSALYNPAMANTNTTRSFADWLILFTDEPDWGMDKGLFGTGDPRYSKIPYGNEKGTGSQAPFHMYFPRESWVTNKIMPTLKQGMAHLRFAIFGNLAQVALSARDNYWAARFLGCAIHYLEDMAVPYHASAVPFLNPLVMAKAIFAKDRERFNSDKTQLLSNRHFLYEAVAKRLQMLSADSIEKIYPALAQRIAKMSAEQDEKAETTNTILMTCFNSANKLAFKHAHKIDKLVGKSFPKKLVADPTYDPFADGKFDVSVYFSDSQVQGWLDGQRDKTSKIMNEISIDLNRAVEAAAAAMLATLR